MKKLAIIGSSDLGRQIAHYAINNGYSIIGFFDDFQSKSFVDGYPILGKCSDIQTAYSNNLFDELVCAIGYKYFEFRQKVFERFSQIGIPFATIVDESCHIDITAKIGAGTILFPGVFIDKGVCIGDNVLINICSTIAHDTIIDSHTFISPRVAIAGFSKVGKRCMLGINSTIIDNISIEDDIKIGGGTIVVHDLADRGLYVGAPARFVR